MRTRVAIIAWVAVGMLTVAPVAAAGDEAAWTDQFGTAQPEEAEGIAVDAAGNSYVVGWTAGRLAGQPSAGTVDAFVRRYGAAGDEVWTSQFGSWDRDFARDVAVDGAGGVYVVGETEGTLPGLRSAGGRDAFVRRYDAAGRVLWTRQFGGGGGEGAWGVAVDAAGNAYVSGSTRAALPGQTANGDWDGFVVKLTPSGDRLWERQFGTPHDDGTASVTVDPAGRAWVVGSTNGALGGPPAGGYDGYVRVYGAEGEVLRTAQFGSAGDDFAVDVASDAAGRVSVAGTTDRTLPGQVSAGGTDAFVRLYGAAGEDLWIHQFGTPRTDDAWSVAADADGNTYVAGTTEQRLPGQHWAGEADIYVRRYNPSGVEMATRQIGGPDRDLAFAVAVDGNGTPHVAGGTFGALPGGRPSAGARDAYALTLR